MNSVLSKTIATVLILTAFLATGGNACNASEQADQAGATSAATNSFRQTSIGRAANTRRASDTACSVTPPTFSRSLCQANQSSGQCAAAGDSGRLRSADRTDALAGAVNGAAITAETESLRRPRIGLALGGGGTRGCAHIGVLRVLEREGIPVDLVAGTSMGAIVGGLYCAGITIDEIEKMIYDRKLTGSYLTVPIPVRLAVVPVFFLPHMVGYHPYDGLYRGRKFANFISSSVPAGQRLIENMKTPFCAVASNLLDGKAYGIMSGDLGTAVQASSALPFLRRPVEWGDKLLIDGGVVENLPVDRARAMGADIVIAVNVDDDLTPLTGKNFRRIGSATARAINMHLSAIDLHPQRSADLVIHPDVTGISILSKNQADVSRAVRSGEEAALRAIPVLKQMIKEKSVAARSGPDAS